MSVRRTDDHSVIGERRRKRRELLVRVYGEVDGSVTRFVSGVELGEGQGMARAEVDNAIAYMEEKGWVRVDDHRAGLLRLTASGVDEAERLIVDVEGAQ